MISNWIDYSTAIFCLIFPSFSLVVLSDFTLFANAYILTVFVQDIIMYVILLTCVLIILNRFLEKYSEDSDSYEVVNDYGQSIQTSSDPVDYSICFNAARKISPYLDWAQVVSYLTLLATQVYLQCIWYTLKDAQKDQMALDFGILWKKFQTLIDMHCFLGVYCEAFFYLAGCYLIVRLIMRRRAASLQNQRYPYSYQTVIAVS